MFGLFLDLFPVIRMLQTIMNNGVEWAVILYTGYTNPLAVKRLLSRNEIHSWGFFTIHDKWVDPEPHERSENYMTREELLSTHPALSADWGKARAEAIRQADFDAESMPAEDKDVFATVFYTKKRDAVRAYFVMAKQSYPFYRIPAVVQKALANGVTEKSAKKEEKKKKNGKNWLTQS